MIKKNENDVVGRVELEDCQGAIEIIGKFQFFSEPVIP
jgi:hypothetical protein